MYENFWPQLLRRLERGAPSIKAKPNRLRLNYWTFAGPTVPGAWSVWSCNFPKNPSRLRVEIYFGNELQRRGVDVLDVLRRNEDVLSKVYDRPEQINFEKWMTGGGHVAERLAVYRSGDAALIKEHDEYLEWFTDRLAQLQAAVQAACEAEAPLTAVPESASHREQQSAIEAAGDRLGYVEELVALLDRNP